MRFVPRLCEFNPGICLTTEEKHGKTSVRVVKYAVSHYQNTHPITISTISTPTLLPKPHTSIPYKTHTYDNISLNSSSVRNVLDQNFRERTHFMFRNFFRQSCFFFTVEKCGRAEQATEDNIIWRMRIACWIPQATDTHSEYVILIAFPQQRRLHELPSILRYTYIACLVSSLNFKNAWSFISAPLCVFIAWCLIKQND